MEADRVLHLIGAIIVFLFLILWLSPLFLPREILIQIMEYLR